MPRSSTIKVSRRWVTVNGLISLLGQLGIPSVRVRYEDLVADPRRQLRRIAAVEGLADEELRWDFLNPHGMTVPATHVVAGSRIRLVDGVLPIRLDEAWRREMAAPARRLVSAVTLPTRVGYGYR